METTPGKSDAADAPEAQKWLRRTPPWMASGVFHLAMAVLLGLISVAVPATLVEMTLTPAEVDVEELMALPSEFGISSSPQEAIGAPLPGESALLDVMAPLFSDKAQFASEFVLDTTLLRGKPAAEDDALRNTAAPLPGDKPTLRGTASVNASGTIGAVDRITQEILLSLEQQPTLVAWFFDQSGSLAPQRTAILKRLDRIYEELGVIAKSGQAAMRKHQEQPLLSSVIAFGQEITFLTQKPTDSVEEIKSAVGRIGDDDTGLERTFEAVHSAAERFRPLRTGSSKRNILFVIFSDEAGDDEELLDRALGSCRRQAITVYCVGVPATFGRHDLLVRYVDPDPRFDQQVQWIPVRQGPETAMQEVVNLKRSPFSARDSGFAPFALTRLCFETGGTYFIVHERDGENLPQTNFLTARFDEEKMRDYAPDYVSVREYKKLLSENKARSALVEAASLPEAEPLAVRRASFPMVEEAEFNRLVSEAQRDAALVEPQLHRVYEVLRQGERDRGRLTGKRWQASYDLSMGRVLAAKIRAESFNLVLARAKQGVQRDSAEDDMLHIRASNDLGVSNNLEKLAEQASEYLQRVVKEHPDTPWAADAKEELRRPFGWRLATDFTNLAVKRREAAVAARQRPRQDDQPRNLPKPELRAAPKL